MRVWPVFLSAIRVEGPVCKQALLFLQRATPYLVLLTYASAYYDPNQGA